MEFDEFSQDEHEFVAKYQGEIEISVLTGWRLGLARFTKKDAEITPPEQVMIYPIQG